jgi:hypothetical protein
MSGTRPYGVGPYGAGAWPGYVVRELAGLAVAGVDTRGDVQRDVDGVAGLGDTAHGGWHAWLLRTCSDGVTDGGRGDSGRHSCGAR